MVAIVVLCVFAAFILGYRFYARFIGERIYQDREEMVTPAYELEDGQDYVPTNKHILFGHHFTSIAGAAPIIGPCIASYWGVLPALLWIVLGTIFIGAVHDFGALVLSIRSGARSVAEIAGSVITPRVRLMFFAFVIMVTWLVLAVFAMAIAGLFVGQPGSVLPVNIGTLIALGMGFLLYKLKVGALLPSLVALGLLYFFTWFGAQNPIDFTQPAGEAILGMGWSTQEATSFWVVFLFLYAGVASLLPVWMLLQPRDYINSHQLMVGLFLLFAGIVWANPTIDAPWVREDATGVDPSAPPIFPFLFVTIACGAISGFHALVASGTTSKQLKSMKDARMIGYGSMLGEGLLATATVLAAVAGIALVGECTLPGGRFIQDLDWATYYDTWSNASSSSSGAFVEGGAAFLTQLGFGSGFAKTMMAVLVVSFAATTLDTATRITRLIVAELGGAVRIKPLQNRFIATVVALAPALLLVFSSAYDPSIGEEREVGWILWPIFGASNQMLAALTLMVLVLYFWQRRRPVMPLVIPMLVIIGITITALILKIGQFSGQGNWYLVGISCVLLVLILWMLFEGLAMVTRGRGPSEDTSESNT